jgi:hypothetical protein
MKNLTPAEIDTLWNAESIAIRTAFDRVAGSTIRYDETRNVRTRKGINYSKMMSPAALLELHAERLTDAKAVIATYEAWRVLDSDTRSNTPCPVGANDQTRAQSVINATVHTDALREALAAVAACEAEYLSRPWNRAYIVVSSANGHVHRNWCGSWRWTTLVAIVVEMSGKDETDIVDYAGAQACSRCFKTAPVSV